MAGIVTLTTDFGLQDAYVGAMKGVVLGIAPGAQVVDLCHEVSPQDVAAGAFVLGSAYRYFPDGTIHVAVVDPGVGSRRRGLVVETARHRFVGPDNGVFSPVYAAEEVTRIVEIRRPDLALPDVSATFHGRDVFAPAAAHLCRGIPVDAFGPSVSDPVKLDLWHVRADGAGVEGYVVHIDRFGNCITNLPRDRIAATCGRGRLCIEAGQQVFERLHRTYGDVSEGRALVLFGSLDTLEVSINGGHAADALGIRRGDRVRVRTIP